MIFTLDELHSAQNNPKINSISLELLREFYKVFLSPNIYKFTFTSDNKIHEIELRFPIENFCHLVGLETIVRKNVPYSQLKQYKGLLGWENIKNEQITFKTLKNINKGRFNNGKSKMVFFYFLPQLLGSGCLLSFDQNKVDSTTRVECRLLFYDVFQNAYVHLGIEKKGENNFYIPRTFLVEKVTKQNKGTKFIKDQIKIEVKDRKIISL